ncbi:hypothetical protein D9M68_803950 [compost metagenome]
MNEYRQLIDLLAGQPLQQGEVTAVHGDGTVTVQLPGGGQQRVRGTATVSDLVFFKDGKLDGEAPDLPLIFIEE